jgi:hypothetical protein
MKVAVIYRHRHYFHYDLDWRDTFINSEEIDVQAFEYRVSNIAKIKKLLKFDVIILLHSVDLGYPDLDYKLFSHILKYRSGKLVYFPRNEFKNFSPKRQFITKSQVDLVASQLPLKAAMYLYGDLTDVVSLPHALNVEIYKPSLSYNKRKISIGGRSIEYPNYLINNSRNRILIFIKELKKIKPSIKINYSTNPEERFNRHGWSRFLGTCKFTVASEAGSSYLDKTDKLQKQIRKYIRNHPNADIEVLKRKFRSKIKNFPSGKCISSRHFEAAGTKTCQILFEGNYSGILKPDEHYISLKKDLSNLEEVLKKIEDTKSVRKIIETSSNLVLKNHTHQHRISKLFKVLKA